MEAKLFDGDRAPVSTFAFHQHRERAPHLEQGVHRSRLELAARLVREAAGRRLIERAAVNILDGYVTVSDLGCGDGGLLQLLKDDPSLEAWGYDFQPSNPAGWAERGIEAYSRNVFDAGAEMAGLPINPSALCGEIVIMTEVLEHLSRPHQVLAWLAHPNNGGRGRYLVCSSPWTETAESHDACHAWAWDQDGYRAMIESAGFDVLAHETTGMFQVVMAKVKG
jgi:hypothetical protein